MLCRRRRLARLVTPNPEDNYVLYFFLKHKKLKSLSYGLKDCTYSNLIAQVVLLYISIKKKKT